jgi:hypothetical protein
LLARSAAELPRRANAAPPAHAAVSRDRFVLHDVKQRID